MSQNLIIICILGILLWYYFMKTKEFEYKNIQLYNEIQNRDNQVRKLKSKNKYLQTYKTDVSNTFKILNNELDSINEIIKPTTTTTSIEEVPSSTVETPPQSNLLNFLIENRQQTRPILNQERPSLQGNLFTSFLNNFLTQSTLPQGLETMSRLPENAQEIITREQLQENIQQQENTQQQENIQQQENTQQQRIEPQTRSSIHFSVDYIPLRGNYNQFLMDPIPEVPEESET